MNFFFFKSFFFLAGSRKGKSEIFEGQEGFAVLFLALKMKESI